MRKKAEAAKRGCAMLIRHYLEHQGKSQAERLDILLIVGPEGGFTEREAAEAEAAGAAIVGLGKRILRTETAAMVGLACLMYESGEMGGV